MKSASSILTRLTLTLAAAVSIVLLLAGAATVFFQSEVLRQYHERDLRARAEMVANLIRLADRPDRFLMIEDKIIAQSDDEAGVRFHVQGPAPYQIGEMWPTDVIRMPGEAGVYKVKAESRTFLAMDIALPQSGERPALTLTAAVDLAPLTATREQLTWGVIVVTVIGVLAAVLLMRAVARRELKPVARLSVYAAALNPADQSQRLPRDALPRELVGLVDAFNGALSRLEGAYASLASFNADVAHELRTPLANIIGETQVALSRRRTAPELEEVLQSNLEDFERLRRIINDMLFLAHADQGAIAAGLERRSLAELVNRTADYMDLLLEEANVTLQIEGDAVAGVEPSLMGRAITNLIDNAVQHGGSPGAVTVLISEQNGDVCLAVRNQGAPIPAERIERLFDRFYRVDPSREGSAENHGLGLAIVKAVVAMHQGHVFARCEDGSVIVGFSLKAEPTAL